MTNQRRRHLAKDGRTTPASVIGECEQAPGIVQPRIRSAKQDGSNREQRLTARGDSIGIGRLVEQARPAILKRSEPGAADSARNQFQGGDPKPWLGRRRSIFEPLKRLAPPCQPDRAKCGLGGAGDNFAERVVDREQCVKSSAELDRPVQSDKVSVAVAQRPSDRGPPAPPLLHRRA